MAGISITDSSGERVTVPVQKNTDISEALSGILQSDIEISIKNDQFEVWKQGNDGFEYVGGGVLGALANEDPTKTSLKDKIKPRSICNYASVLGHAYLLSKGYQNVSSWSEQSHNTVIGLKEIPDRAINFSPGHYWPFLASALLGIAQYQLCFKAPPAPPSSSGGGDTKHATETAPERTGVLFGIAALVIIGGIVLLITPGGQVFLPGYAAGAAGAGLFVMKDEPVCHTGML